MTRSWTSLGASLVLLSLCGAAVRADHHELKTLETAAETVRDLSAIPIRCIPHRMIREAHGIAIIPHVVKAGFVIDGRFGRGVVLVRQGDHWSNPVFITLTGAGVGLQAGVQSTDVVLVFRTASSLDRILRGKGKLTLGGDVSIAAGPIGREAEAATDARLRAEIYSYSRSRGLFAGASLEGAALLVDRPAMEAFYAVRPPELAMRGLAGVDNLKAQLLRMSGPDCPPAGAPPLGVVVPGVPAPPPFPPPPAPPGFGPPPSAPPPSATPPQGVIVPQSYTYPARSSALPPAPPAYYPAR